MAFSSDETWAGGFWSWMAFVAMMLAAFTVSLVVPMVSSPAAVPPSGADVALILLIVGFALVVGGGVSMVVMLCCLPLVRLIAKALRRVRRVYVHVTVYALLGAAIGVLALAMLGLAADPPVPTSALRESPLQIITILVCAASPALGWWRASRHARRELAARGDASGFD